MTLRIKHLILAVFFALSLSGFSQTQVVFCEQVFGC